MMDLSAEQTVTVLVVYSAALVPLAGLALIFSLGKLPRWIAAVYMLSFLACAAGWEVWLTFGLCGGEEVDVRRPEALSRAIPQSVNWLLNSLADASGICLVGLLLVWLAYRRKPTAFREWRWGAVGILLAWFVSQNVFVELLIYHTQLGAGHVLSWAPLIPTGPWWNPTLLEVDGRTVQFQTQIPWVLMTFIFYGIVIACYRRLGEPT